MNFIAVNNYIKVLFVIHAFFKVNTILNQPKKITHIKTIICAENTLIQLNINALVLNNSKKGIKNVHRQYKHKLKLLLHLDVNSLFNEQTLNPKMLKLLDLSYLCI